MAKTGTDSILPETLEHVWDGELAALFAVLNFKQQTFVLDYLYHGIGTKAYEKAYGVSGPSAWASASALLRETNVRAFITAFRDSNGEQKADDLHLIRSTLRQAIATAETPVFSGGDFIMDKADWTTRVKASQALAKLDGHNAPDKVQVDTSESMRQFFSALQGGK